MDLIDALRAEDLDAAAARALLDRAAASTPREAWLAILRDETVPQVARRLVIRRLLEAEARPGATLAELGALIAADAWLQPTHVRQVSVVNGKLPVQWLAEDLVIAIDVCPALLGDGDRHRLVVYLRIAGQPDVDEIALALRGGAGGEHEVREIGFSETEAARPGGGPGASVAPRAPLLGALVMCRRALCDAQTGMHTLVDVIVEIPVQLPGPAMFDIYLQLRRITGPATLAVDVIGPGDVDDSDEVVLTTGTLSLGAREGASGPPPPVLGIAIPNVVVGFERAGEHRLRVRCGAELLGEHHFRVADEAVA
jgi:hypothetical protein